MLIDRKNLPAQLPWIALVALGTLGAAGWYIACGVGRPRWPGGSSPPGLAFGIVAGAIMVFGLLLWPRKMVRSWRIGRAQDWLRAHIWLCFLSVPLVALHSGFQLGGPLSTWLTVLFAVVIASGLFGLALQQFLPTMMWTKVPAETIYSQIDYVAGQFYRTAEDLVLATCGSPANEPLSPGRDAEPMAVPYLTIGAVRSVGNARGKVLQTEVPVAPVAGAEILRDAFHDAVGPYLLRGSKSASPLRQAEEADDFFRHLRKRLTPPVHPAVDILASLCDQRRQFDLQARLHLWLHTWLCVHLPLSIALVGLMFVHVFYALKYW